MSAWTLTLRGREEVAEGTAAFRFDKPVGFDFRAGQAIDLILPADGGEASGARHAFSLVTAPHEDVLVVATRMRDSAFKRALGKLSPGDKASCEGPFGSLTLHADPARGAVFIAGGIGITPFMSLLRQAAKVGGSRQFALVYANHRPEDAAFLGELEALAQASGNFRLVATMTGLERSRRPWHGETGRVDAAMVRRAADGLARPVHYLAGPPAMVSAVHGALEQAGVAEEDLREESFFGY